MPFSFDDLVPGCYEEVQRRRRAAEEAHWSVKTTHNAEVPAYCACAGLTCSARRSSVCGRRKSKDEERPDFCFAIKQGECVNDCDGVTLLQAIIPDSCLIRQIKSQVEEEEERLRREAEEEEERLRYEAEEEERLRREAEEEEERLRQEAFEEEERIFSFRCNATRADTLLVFSLLELGGSLQGAPCCS